MVNVIQSEKEPQEPKVIVAKGAGVKRNRSGEATRRKILEAAEAVFAAKGLEAASLREIMIAARVNIAAVNYYFGSKADLLAAVVSQRTDELNRARIALLEQAKVRDGGVASIEGWLHALIDPFIEAEGSKDPGWRNFVHILNWLATTRDPDYQHIVGGTYESLRRAFVPALGEALPELSAEEITWRYHSVVAVLRASLSERDRTAAQFRGIVDPDDFRRMMGFVIPFLAAGLRLPPVASKPTVN
jgi:AcrR family transcriptional regulator